MKGTDHNFSLEPQGLRKLVRDIRRAEVALGEVKRVHESEIAPIRKMACSVRAARRIRVGEPLSLDLLAVKSPADPSGLAPYRLDDLIGLPAREELDVDDLIPREWLD